ncbi:MAG TPA: lipid-A-disaccharide synthase [Nitrospiria bacterium]|nr:lipid-A-disaccharide synthase [Nitrospiria bacterium]
MSQRTILIVTGEASGDLHGAELARALLQQQPDLRLLGMGGARMKVAGVELIFDNRQLGVMGLIEVLQRWRSVLRAFKTVEEVLLHRGVDLVVLIDSPDFNLRVARLAKRMKIPAVYYIGPKVWAWRAGRLKTVKKWVDRMLVIFPFEEPLYRDAGVPCEFVGHPLLDEIPNTLDRHGLRRRYEIPDDAVVVALLPGSRWMEINRLLDVMTEALRRVREDLPSVVGIMPVASSLSMAEIRQKLSARADDLRLVAGDAPQVLACSDFAVVASGTATLEAAIVGTPMVVVYKVTPLTMLLARLLVKIRSSGLVNILAGRVVAPELLQSNATPQKIAAVVLDHLRNPDKMQEQKKSLEEVREKLGLPGAAHRAAAGILKILSQTARTVTV